MSRQIINVGASDNDPAAESVRSAFQKANSMFDELYKFGGLHVHNVLAYGAAGDGSYSAGTGTDDTSAIQAAYTAATASGGFAAVLFPGRRTYRISSSIAIPQGVYTIGEGGQELTGVNNPPMIFWTGANDGVMMRVTSPFANAPMTLFKNICLSYSSTPTNKPGYGVYFDTSGGASGNPDSGSGFDNVWIVGMNQNALHFATGGVTNFFIRNGRFDSNLGYGIYADLKSTAGASFVGIIDGNTNWVGGGRGQGKGFIFMDGESATADGSDAHLVINGIHTEVNQNLTQTFASGTNTLDKYGIIRLGVTPALNNMQHRVLINGWRNSSAGGLNSYSAIQITAASGTDAAASECIGVEIHNANGISAGVTETGATGEVRPIGGKIPTNERYPASYTGSVRTLEFTFGKGKNSTGEGYRGYRYQRHGSYTVRGLTLLPEVFANLDSFPQAALAEAYITDCTTATAGATAAGGGSNKVKVYNNGSGWKVAYPCN